MSEVATHEDWQVHAPCVQTIDPCLISHVSQSMLVPEVWKPALKFLSDPAKYPLTQTLPNKLFPRSAIPHRFILTLLASSIIEHIDRPEHSNFGYCFLVEEINKRRYRLVCDTIAVNATVETPTPNFVPVAEVRNMCARYPERSRYAAVYDMKAFFFQFPLAPDVRNNFVFRVGDFYFRFTRLPMGTTFAPTIAQTVLLFLVRSANEEGLMYDAYIDNLLILSPDVGSLERFHKRFTELCARYGCTIGDYSGVTTAPVHRGIHFDLDRRLFRLSDPFLNKLSSRLAEFSRRHWLSSAQSCMKIMGSVIYALSAQSRPLADVFPLIRILGKYARRESHIPIPQSSRDIADQTVSSILANSWRSLEFARPPPFTMITDASTSAALGSCVLCTPSGNILSTAFAVPEADINVMEANAVLAGISHFAHRIKHHIVHLVSDNTAVLFALRGTQARAWQLNSVIARIIHTVQHLRCALQLFYVESAHNPADGLSRGLSFSRQPATTALVIHAGLLTPQQVVAGVHPIAESRARLLFFPKATSNKQSTINVQDTHITDPSLVVDSC
jgi:hypothetical protein